MLEIQDLTIEIENKKIIEKLSFVANRGDKIAIIGEEGNGKSTLLKAIYDETLLGYAKLSGSINKKDNSIGYLEQVIDEKYLDLEVFTYLFENEDEYYEKINSFYNLLDELHIYDEILNKHIRVLSGGEKVKIQLLKILLSGTDILLLDEPTNDLDIETLVWLEEFINSYDGPIIFVSHDEYLLGKTANVILHLELIRKKSVARNTVVRCDYDTYVEKRLRSLTKQTQVSRKENAIYKKQQKKLSQIMNKVHHELNTISRGDPHGAKMLKRKMKSLKSQEKRFDEKELTELPDVEESINIYFDEVNVPSKKVIIDINIPTLVVGDKVLSKDVSLKVMGNEHIAIIGNNGCGKTTLIKEIVNGLKEKSDLVVGYMPQNYEDILDFNKTPIEVLSKTYDQDEESLIRSYMSNINFTKEETTSATCKLSGGSRAKLILLKLILDKCNILVLDEPTRNVSPLSNPVIRNILGNFNGTIISVSHDRKYIEEVCDKIYKLDNNGLIEL
jgi:ATPase components of ABC transporters with duplicated ATPase domains